MIARSFWKGGRWTPTNYKNYTIFILTNLFKTTWLLHNALSSGFSECCFLSAILYRVVEVQGSTHTVEPVEGGPGMRVHRDNIRLCARPVAAPSKVRSSVPIVATSPPTEVSVDFPDLDPDPE